MKLRNKKTGEIGNLVLNINPNRESYSVLSTENGDTICGNLVIADYDTLAKLNEEWEDYEEPKEIYFISNNGQIHEEDGHDRYREARKEIGNYFETREEAEQAVERLHAWKRLKDNGFEFRRWEIIDGTINFMILPKGDYREKVYEDLRICFGGEE